MILKILVSGQEDLKASAGGALEKFAILQPWPTLILDCLSFVFFKLTARRRGSCSSSRMRTDGQRLISSFERRDRPFARDGGKVVEKLFEAMAPFQIVD